MSSREERDAADLESLSERELLAIVEAPVGGVSETTRELARLELERRKAS